MTSHEHPYSMLEQHPHPITHLHPIAHVAEIPLPQAPPVVVSESTYALSCVKRV